MRSKKIEDNEINTELKPDKLIIEDSNSIKSLKKKKLKQITLRFKSEEQHQKAKRAAAAKSLDLNSLILMTLSEANII